jgi:hypothetical protein
MSEAELLEGYRQMAADSDERDALEWVEALIEDAFSD